MATLSPSFDRAVEHHRAGEIDKAVALYRHALKTSPRDVRCMHHLASALSMQGQIEQAVETLRLAVKTEETTPGGGLGSRRMLASALFNSGHAQESIETWRHAAARIDHPEPKLCLVQQLAEARRTDEAMTLAGELAAASPDYWPGVYELARLCERLGRDDEARSALESVAAKRPDFVEAQLLLARLDARTGRLDAAKSRLEAVIATPSRDPRLDAAGPAMIEMAQVADRQGQYALAFEMARRGQQANFSKLPGPLRDGRMHERVIDLGLKITGEMVAEWPSPSAGSGLAASDAPIFIVGFPRSGTTLLEQMLSAHPRLAVTDEAPHLQRVRERLFATYRPKGEFPTDLGAFTTTQIDQGRKWYFQRVRDWLGPKREGRRIVDKQPLNVADLGLVRLLFPESPVVFVGRDPRDSVLSTFMQGFTRGVPHLFSLEGTARMYARLMELWSHDKNVLGLKWMEIRYEELVTDSQRVLEQLIQFIGETWDPAMLQAHAPGHRRYVTTPSYADVAQPVHGRSIGRWRNYEAQLAPIMEALRPWVDKWGGK